MQRRNLLKFAALALPVLALGSFGKAMSAEPEINTDGNGGPALGGFDAVSYFAASGPVEGKTDFATDWKGAKWQFSSAENLAAFKASPDKYAPQYGGYCAYAVSKGATAPGDPMAWTVDNDKLYLTFSKSVKKTWQTDIPGNVKLADGNWPKVLEE